jgi:DNA-binding XRE family transcriptional regulator
MAKQDLSLAKKKEWAKMLFLNSQFNQKEIAAQVGISEQTMTKWSNDGGWDKLKVSLLTTNAEQLAFLYDVLKKLNEQARIALTDDDPETTPDTDGIIKITKAIHYLQTKTGIGQMYETGMAFLTFLQRENPPLAKDVAPLFHAFIKENL